MDNNLVKECLPLVYAISKKFYGIEKEDLIQAGMLGLINAYNHFDRKGHTKFSTFAYTYIFGEMYNLSVSKNLLKVNKDTLKLIKLIDKTNTYLTQKLNKSPSIGELSKYLKISEDDIISAINYQNSLISLDGRDEESLYDTLFINEDSDYIIDLKNSLDNLSLDEQKLIHYRYFNDLTQSQTAKLLNMSQVSVSRCEQKTLKKLKKELIYE